VSRTQALPPARVAKHVPGPAAESGTTQVLPNGWRQL